jgi:DNA polymerase-3 subunit chi
VTRIKFFHGATDRLTAAADWLRREWPNRDGHILVYAPHSGIAERLDRLLWTQPANGFLPHCHLESPLAPETPILLAQEVKTPPYDHCLLNLADTPPPGFARFEELVEIVSTADSDRLPARERFKFYRERGYTVEASSISSEYPYD